MPKNDLDLAILIVGSSNLGMKKLWLPNSCFAKSRKCERIARGKKSLFNTPFISSYFHRQERNVTCRGQKIINILMKRIRLIDTGKHNVQLKMKRNGCDLLYKMRLTNVLIFINLRIPFLF